MTETAPGTVPADDDLPEYPAPRSGACPFAPPPGLLALHDSDKTVRRVRTWDGSTPWLVLGHAAQRAVLADPRLSANIGAPGYPHTTAAMKAHAAEMQPSINNTDGAEHQRWRRMLTSSFTRHRMEKLRPEIQRITDDLVDKMLAGPNPTELNEALSLPLPSLMICALLGVPYSDHPFFQEHAGVTNALYRTPEEAAATTAVLRRYIAELIEKKMDDPGEDVLSDLGVRVKEGILTMEEAAPLGHILLVAGHDTSANMVTLGTALLLQNEEQLTALREHSDDPAYVTSAVEELLRYLTLPHMLARRAVAEDFEFEGETFRAGEGVIASLPAANWDAEAFPDPGRLDLTRKAGHHLAFGWGPHQCVGQQLARIELQVVFSTLFRRIPTLRLDADLEDLTFKEDSQAYGIYELPVAW
ncbi:cytochrome P450 [Streptomyces sp. NBC_01239]|uniref:cytochrome P450 n=1 Tax=Streptomyces sp. NBC_01239 TaxID=2903792 RepID=UPI00225BE1A5|nr:cytochrome P450 [Streptomyces sp. NBC_01239]MCX4815247.1 cytochrome P450 [Streptomyces sp. NBC_01239]